ncbi:Ig-like and fibronectin type-III domain-containing protein [Sarcoptes scabiei]|nr:Ig-like and fibronectin type-III domain-containing protein [Sarcoptes scabiei]
MEQVLNGRIAMNDIIFVHRKGKRKEIEIMKNEIFLGLTIADNCNGCCYIKRIKSNSTISKIPFIKIGDHIQSIKGESMLGKRHYEVAAYLKSIPLNEIFTITLVEPVIRSSRSLRSDEIQNYFHRNYSSYRCESRNDDDGDEDEDCEHKDLDEKNNEINLNIDNEEERDKFQFGSTIINGNKSLNSSSISTSIGTITNIGEDSTTLHRPKTWTTIHLDRNEHHQQHRWRLCSDPQQLICNINESELQEFRFDEKFLRNIWSIINQILSGGRLRANDLDVLNELDVDE